MAASVEVELAIFSGLPNPTWILGGAESDQFTERLAALPRAPARSWQDKLGYRGFVVRLAQGTARIQGGMVRVCAPGMNIYANDIHRELERWLLHTGRLHLKDEVFQAAARELP